MFFSLYVLVYFETWRPVRKFQNAMGNLWKVFQAYQAEQ